MKRKTEAYLRQRELDRLAERMAHAMQTAYPPYIATTERFTLIMKIIWAEYVELMRSYCKRREMSTTCVIYEEA